MMYSVYFEGQCDLEASSKEDAEQQFQDFLTVLNNRFENGDKPSNLKNISCMVYSATECWFPIDKEV